MQRVRMTEGEGGGREEAKVAESKASVKKMDTAWAVE